MYELLTDYFEFAAWVVCGVLLLGYVACVIPDLWRGDDEGE